MITDVPGIKVGHATDHENHTGCTVILCPEGTVGGGEIRGLSPGSRESALLAPDKKMGEVHAILLTGGSAFGLAAADGVMRWLEEHDIGYWTPIVRVPIVPAAVIFDLFLTNGRRPDAEMGYTACQNASSGPVSQGNVGAGAGAVVGKWAALEGIMKGGFGTASLHLETTGESGGLVVGAVAVTNCTGDVLAADGSVISGARSADGGWQADIDPLRRLPESFGPQPGANTTLVAVATNARLSKVQVNWLAQRAHDGLAIAIRPVHTFRDGDTAFALATNQVDAAYDLVANATVEVVVQAIRSSVRAAETVENIPGLASASSSP